MSCPCGLPTVLIQFVITQESTACTKWRKPFVSFPNPLAPGYPDTCQLGNPTRTRARGKNVLITFPIHSGSLQPKLNFTVSKEEGKIGVYRVGHFPRLSFSGVTSKKTLSFCHCHGEEKNLHMKQSEGKRIPALCQAFFRVRCNCDKN